MILKNKGLSPCNRSKTKNPYKMVVGMVDRSTCLEKAPREIERTTVINPLFSSECPSSLPCLCWTFVCNNEKPIKIQIHWHLVRILSHIIWGNITSTWRIFLIWKTCVDAVIVKFPLSKGIQCKFKVFLNCFQTVNLFYSDLSYFS